LSSSAELCRATSPLTWNVDRSNDETPVLTPGPEKLFGK